MRKIRISVFIIYVSFLGSFKCLAQNRSIGPLAVGQVIPNYKFNDVHNYKGKSISISDFKGKWLVMDFGGPNCAGCIAHIPDFNHFQEEFGKDIQVLLVEELDRTWKAAEEKDPFWKKQTYAMYDKMVEKYHLVVPIAFDTVIQKKIQVNGMPYIVIVDPRGTIRGITETLTRDNLVSFLKGKAPLLNKAYSSELGKRMGTRDHHRPLLTNSLPTDGVTDTSFLYRSLLTVWNEYQGSYDVGIWPGRFEAIGVNLCQLYKIAYFGSTLSNSVNNTKVCPNCYYAPLFLTKDSLLFNSPGIYSSTKQDIEHTYSYSLSLKRLGGNVKNDTLIIQSALQKDLQILFPYEALIERLKRPIYRLVANSSAKNNLKTKGGVSKISNHKSEGGDLVNQRMSRLTDFILSQALHKSHEIVIDNTGISENIDIHLNCNLTDFDDVLRALKENGLDLIRDEKEMNVLVIRDKLPASIN